MNSDPFYTFLALVDQDAHVRATSKKIAQLSQKKQSLDDTLHKIQHDFADARANAHDAKKRLDAQELEIKILNDRQRALHSKRDAASSPKEYFSLETELKNIAAEIDIQESRLFALFTQYEALEKKLGEIDYQLVTSRAKIMQDVADIEQQIHMLQEQLQQYSDTYESLKVGVNPEMLEKFLVMKQSVENPVMPVEKNACSACFNTLTSQELISIRKHALISCKNCFRLLYAAPS